MADVERNTLSVKRMLASESISPSLAKRIVEADVDKNGELSLEEVMQVSGLAAAAAVTAAACTFATFARLRTSASPGPTSCR